MKKITTILVAAFATLFFTACGGGSSGDSTPNPIEVNLLGTWDYQVSMQNSICDNKVAQGITIIESLNGDETKVGDTTLQGTKFAIDGNRNCYLDSLDKVHSLYAGYPSTMTVDEYLKLAKEVNAGDNTIKSIRVDSFTNNKIVSVTEYTNGVIGTTLYIR